MIMFDFRKKVSVFGILRVLLSCIVACGTTDFQLENSGKHITPCFLGSNEL